jgi:hypothetical protein
MSSRDWSVRLSDTGDTHRADEVLGSRFLRRLFAGALVIALAFFGWLTAQGLDVSERFHTNRVNVVDTIGEPDSIHVENLSSDPIVVRVVMDGVTLNADEPAKVGSQQPSCYFLPIGLDAHEASDEISPRLKSEFNPEDKEGCAAIAGHDPMTTVVTVSDQQSGILETYENGTRQRTTPPPPAFLLPLGLVGVLASIISLLGLAVKSRKRPTEPEISDGSIGPPAEQA